VFDSAWTLSFVKRQLTQSLNIRGVVEQCAVLTNSNSKSVFVKRAKNVINALLLSCETKNQDSLYLNVHVGAGMAKVRRNVQCKNEIVGFTLFYRAVPGFMASLMKLVAG
jgi:hypothetical protein